MTFDPSTIRVVAVVVLATLGTAFCVKAVSAEPVPTVRLAKPGHGYVPPQTPVDDLYWHGPIVRAYRLDAEAAVELAYLLRHKRLRPQSRPPVEAPKP